MAQFTAQLNQQLAQLNKQINGFITFVGNKLKNYKNLSLGEQIAFPTIAAGLLLILVSIVLFIL